MARRTKAQILAAKAEEAKMRKAAEFEMTNMTRRAATTDGRTKTETGNHQYPTFPYSGPKTHLGQIGRAFEDIDNRIDGVQAGGLNPGSITADKLKTDAPEDLQAFQDALEVASVDDLDAEAAARQEADTQLETKITTETEARTAADTALEQKVTDEVAKEAAARDEAIATAVEPKADKTYVDEQLATKLDVADVPTADTLDGVTPIGRAVMKAQEKDNARFAIDAAATEHTHEIADVTGLQDALDAKADTSAIPTIPGNATTSQAGLMSAEDKTKLDGMTKMAYIEDPAGDTVTKEEFIAFRDALVTAGIMKPKA